MTNIKTINGIEIETWNVCPPVPVRFWDWAAWRKGDDDEDSISGTGETEEAAIADLLFKLEEA
jgi:hypothetical protein